MGKRSVIGGVGLLLVALLLSSCTGFGKETGAFKDVNYHTGSQGLVMSFIPGAPPERIYEGDSLNLLVQFSNKGATNIEDGRLYVSGYDDAFIHILPQSASSQGVALPAFRAEGKSFFNPAGDLSTTVEYLDPKVTMPPNTDVFPQTFKVTACYRYRTEASANVCIDPDPYNLRTADKVCTAHDTTVGPTGAPVAVTYVQQTTARDRVQFKIGISNVGGGLVLTSAGGTVPLNQCHTDLGRDQINSVEVQAFLSGEPLTCQPAQVRLVNGQGFAFCYLNKNINEAYQTVLNINLDYGYRDSISRSLQIVKLPGSG